MDPDVHVLSYNVGLTNAQVDPDESGMPTRFFKFTSELRNAILMMFTRGAGADEPSTPAHTVFLCELGSQKRDEQIGPRLLDAGRRRSPVGHRVY